MYNVHTDHNIHFAQNSAHKGAHDVEISDSF